MKAAAYAATRNAYSDMIVAAKSLAANSSVDVIHLLIEDIKFHYYIPDYVKTNNVSKQRIFPDYCPNLYKQWTYMSLMRVTFTRLYPNLDKILWLDIDTVVEQNIDELWDLDMDGYYFAGALEPEKSKPGKPYINAGVTMVNLKQLREDGMDDKLIEALNKQKYEFADQDCINELCAGKILVIPPTYNSNKFTEQVENPKIIHFAADKIWNNQPVLYKYRNMNWNDIRRPTCVT